jgi:hypothetical protein
MQSTSLEPSSPHSHATHALCSSRRCSGLATTPLRVAGRHRQQQAAAAAPPPPPPAKTKWGLMQVTRLLCDEPPAVVRMQ